MYITYPNSTVLPMKSLFDATTFQNTLDRLDQLNETAQGQWGKMTVAQMLWHCQIPLRLAVKNKPTTKKGNFLVKLFFKKALYNEKPWRKNLPTAPIAKAKEAKDFEEELPKLRQLICDFYECRSRTEWNPHPLFGTFTHDQWGVFQYKHLDHHLKQFGV